MQGASPCPRARHQSISDFMDKLRRYKQILVFLKHDLMVAGLRLLHHPLTNEFITVNPHTLWQNMKLKMAWQSSPKVLR